MTLIKLKRMFQKHRILITAGPTEEPLDGVRFLSSRSTGRMGLELVREARRRGWHVTLILGPTNIRIPLGVQLIRVRTAREMQEAVRKSLAGCRALIMAAAVSDWRPRQVTQGKIKRTGRSRFIRLVPNPDILKTLPRRSKDPFIRAGFCLEARDPRREARRKLRSKKLDFIVANQLGSNGGPFGNQPVTVWLMDARGRERKIVKASKKRIAQSLFSEIHGAMAE